MAKKIYPITKFRFVAVVVSVLLLLVGLVSYIAFGGFNLGIDFQSGFSQRVQIAPAAVSIVYGGADTVTLNVTDGTVTLVSRDASGSRYQEFSPAEYPTVGELASAISSFKRSPSRISAITESTSSSILQSLNRLGSVGGFRA